MAEAHITYDPAAAHHLLGHNDLRDIQPPLNNARNEVLDDVELLRSGDNIPEHKQPLDAGFFDLPQRLLDEYAADAPGSQLGRMLETAGMLRNELDRMVSLGIGGSYMGARALFEALCPPYHNELPRAERNNVPRFYFDGNNVDNDVLQALLSLLKAHCRNPDDVADRWGILVISKSGGTLETAAAFRLFRAALEEFYGADSEAARRYVVPITGREGLLRELSNAKQYEAVFPVPEGVGGRFSVLSPVGLLPAAVMGLDIVRLLEGAVSMNRRFREASFGNNPVLDYTAVCHLMEGKQGRNIRVLSTWGSRMEAFGLWYDQLLAESLGKDGRGATPLTTVNTRDLHSRGQQHQEGREDKLITNVIVEQPSAEPLVIPKRDDDHDNLNRLAGTSVSEILQAAIAGTNQAYAEGNRPTADFHLPGLNEFTLGELLQCLMLATVVEGRLIGINPYGQPGVEHYKRNMNRILRGDTA